MRLEQLESRDAPAGFVANYTDVDGDHVTLTLSAGTMIIGWASYAQGSAASEVDLTGAEPGASLRMTVVRAPGGDGLSNVGYINATGVDLGTVVIRGDLSRITAGDADMSTPAARAVTVWSLGRLASETQPLGGGLASSFNGPLGRFAVRGDMAGATMSVTGGIDAVVIGGSLVGWSGTSGSGSIYSGGQIGSVRIGGDIQGGGGLASGSVYGSAGITTVRVGGSLIGGFSTSGDNQSSGSIGSNGPIGSVNIGHDIVGGDIFGPGSLRDSGTIAARRLGRVTVGGSIFAGTASNGGTLAQSGAILAIDDIESIIVRGNLIGSSTNRVQIYARGQPTPTAGADFAIKSLRIGGRVEGAWIFGGVDLNGVAVNGNAQIGTVTVGGDWVASSMTSGCTSTDGFLGDANDAALPGATESRIGSINIAGQVFGRRGSNETFGIFAQEIGSFRLAGVSIPLTPGQGNDTFALGAAHALGATFSSFNGDAFAVHVYEV
ncbi:MAG TPA: hypothetical protein VKE40_25095 [Gemmataceae bacterium]|nr:hypothetical protein [Gemmataceae bacterium]